MNRRHIVAKILGLAALTLVLAWHSSASRAQETPTATPEPTPTPTAYPLQGLRFTLLAEADVALQTTGASIVRVASVAIAPGQTSLPYLAEGSTILTVQTGSIRVRTDAGLIEVTDISALIGLAPVEGTPGPLDDTEVGPGRQVLLSSGSTTIIGNTSDTPATVLILTVLPADAPAATPVP